MKGTQQSNQFPFPPSWIDRLVSWIENLPGPTWAFYSVSVLAFAILINVVLWIDGSLDFGSIDPFNTGFSFFIVYWIGLYHHLTRVGSQSLKVFRPLLDVNDAELSRIDYELATLPRRLGWLTIPLAIGFSLLALLGDEQPYGDIVPQTVFVNVLDIVLTSFMVATFFCVLIRSIRQLRMVGSLHARATNINLLKLEPAHAFSTLTSRTGIGTILIFFFSLPFDPQPFGSTLDSITSAVTILLAIAVFVLPIIGMRDRLDKEKNRQLNETSDLLRFTRENLHSKIKNKDYVDLGGMETAISELVRDREMLEKIPTWPWDTRSIRSFSSALILPIFLLLISRVLERYF